VLLDFFPDYLLCFVGGGFGMASGSKKTFDDDD
jgi:hypothetical protein